MRNVDEDARVNRDTGVSAIAACEMVAKYARTEFCTLTRSEIFRTFARRKYKLLNSFHLAWSYVMYDLATGSIQGEFFLHDSHDWKFCTTGNLHDWENG